MCTPSIEPRSGPLPYIDTSHWPAGLGIALVWFLIEEIIDSLKKVMNVAEGCGSATLPGNSLSPMPPGINSENAKIRGLRSPTGGCALVSYAVPSWLDEWAQGRSYFRKRTALRTACGSMS